MNNTSDWFFEMYIFLCFRSNEIKKHINKLSVYFINLCLIRIPKAEEENKCRALHSLIPSSSNSTPHNNNGIHLLSNLDLILLPFLHGAFISCALLISIFLLLILLLLASAAVLLYLAAFDLYNALLLLSECFDSLKANIELCFVVCLCGITRLMESSALILRPWPVSQISGIKVIVHRFSRRHALITRDQLSSDHLNKTFIWTFVLRM